MAARISEAMRDHAYRASGELAKERGAFPLFNADLYLSGPGFAGRLPEEIKVIRSNGIRNSHLLSIAPTGTISLAFADNASNGIEPPFSWTYTRRKRVDSGWQEYTVEDHAYRRYRAMGGDVEALPPYFVTALEMSAKAHEQMVAAVAPFIDTSISKTVNVPEDYPYSEFQDLYFDVEVGPERPRHLPAQQGSRFRAERHGAAGLRPGRRQPPHLGEVRARAGARVAALAGRPISPPATRRGPT